MSKKLAARLSAIPAFVAASMGFAHAALPTGVDTALSDLNTNATSVATTVLLAVVAIFAIKFIRRGL